MMQFSAKDTPTLLVLTWASLRIKFKEVSAFGSIKYE